MKIGFALCSYAILILSLNACPDEIGCTRCTDPKDGPTVCFQCENSFFDSNTKLCNPNVPYVEHCKEYKMDGDKVVCKFCELGYNAENNKCIKCVDEDCAMCTGGTTCLGCFNGWKHIVDLIKPERKCSKEEKCSIANCDVSAHMQDLEKCYRCNIGYAISAATNQCIPSTPGCFLVNSAEDPTCIGCHWGYYIASGGVCRPNPASISAFWILIFLVLSGAIGYFGYNCWKNREETKHGVYIGA